MATFLMLPRSRGAIGRVRATPGALSTAGRPRWTDGLNPRGGKGVSFNVRMSNAILEKTGVSGDAGPNASENEALKRAFEQGAEYATQQIAQMQMGITAIPKALPVYIYIFSLSLSIYIYR